MMGVIPKPISNIDPPIIELEPGGGHPVLPKEGLVVKPLRGSYVPFALQYTRKVPYRKPWNVVSSISGGIQLRFKELVVVYPSLELWLRIASPIEQYIALQIAGKDYGNLVYD